MIDDQPEVTIDDPAFLFDSNDGFQEVTSKKTMRIKLKEEAEQQKKTEQQQKKRDSSNKVILLRHMLYITSYMSKCYMLYLRILTKQVNCQ